MKTVVIWIFVGVLLISLMVSIRVVVMQLQINFQNKCQLEAWTQALKWAPITQNTDSVLIDRYKRTIYDRKGKARLLDYMNMLELKSARPTTNYYGNQIQIYFRSIKTYYGKLIVVNYQLCSPSNKERLFGKDVCVEGLTSIMPVSDIQIATANRFGNDFYGVPSNSFSRSFPNLMLCDLYSPRDQAISFGDIKYNETADILRLWRNEISRGLRINANAINFLTFIKTNMCRPVLLKDLLAQGSIRIKRDIPTEDRWGREIEVMIFTVFIDNPKNANCMDFDIGFKSHGKSIRNMRDNYYVYGCLVIDNLETSKYLANEYTLITNGLDVSSVIDSTNYHLSPIVMTSNGWEQAYDYQW